MRPGAQLVVPGRGYPRDEGAAGGAYRGTGARGDLVVTVRVAAPPRSLFGVRGVALALLAAAVIAALLVRFG